MKAWSRIKNQKIKTFCIILIGNGKVEEKRYTIQPQKTAKEWVYVCEQVRESMATKEKRNELKAGAGAGCR